MAFLTKLREFTVYQVAYPIVRTVVTAKRVRVPSGATKIVAFDVSADRMNGLPNRTFTQGVVAQNVVTTGELAVDFGEVTNVENQETAAADQASVNAETEQTDPVRIRVTFDDQSADGSVVTVKPPESQGDYVVRLDRGLQSEVVRMLNDLWASVNEWRLR